MQAMAEGWCEDGRQGSWLWVGLLFLLFYFAEAFLFWQPNPRFRGPWFTPLIFWGLFGAGVILIVNRKIPGAAPQSRAEKIQSWLLGVGITALVIGLTYLVMSASRNITLGHVTLLAMLALAGWVIGAMSYSPGWIAAALCWAVGAAVIFIRPGFFQDYVLGTAVGVGFVVVGLLRKRFVMRDALLNDPVEP